jgi:CTP:molybdopterin cytidylyltransferase MocA
MKPESTAAIVLAAGFSERMGDFKPLLTLGGMTVLERAVRLFQTAGVGRVHVVVGHRADELMPLIAHAGARSVVNRRFAQGMFSSVAAGVSSLEADTERFFLLPADIPLVRPATLRDLLEAFPSGRQAICHPIFGGRRGHPPLIGADHIPRILVWGGEGGLAALLTRLEPHAVDVAVVDEYIHQDLDRPEDFRRMAARVRHRHVFSPAECEALLCDRLHVPPSVAAHGRAVADMAVRIGEALNLAGYSLDIGLIRAAALVHDMARGKRDHARIAAEMLRELDMPLMADTVASHMDLAACGEQRIEEAAVVFLADKLIQEERYVGLAERFRSRAEDTHAGVEAAAAARRRRESAARIAERVQSVIGLPLESLRSNGRNP